MISADDITREEFNNIQGRYADLVKSISKTAKKGEDTLEQLDQFRYEEAPGKYCQPDPINKDRRQIIPLTAKDLQRSVAWKLKHGKFRPQLMKLAASNSEEDVSKISKAAFEIYENETSNIKGTIKKLSELKGVGPATASLLLSIHDAENILFFGDEVFWWLCCKGKKESIKYNFKEHEDLMENFRELVNRLGEGVSALDVERVGYVMMKDMGPEVSGIVKGVDERDAQKSDDGVIERIGKEEDEAISSAVDKGKEKKRKRKGPTGDELVEKQPRRSKRGKA